MLAHMVIHVTLPAGFSCPGKKAGADPVSARFPGQRLRFWFKAQQAVSVTHHGNRRQRHRRAGDHRIE